MEQSEVDQRLEKCTEAAERLGAALDADVIFFNGDLKYGTSKYFVMECRKRKSIRKNAVLVCVTSGGNAGAAFRIARHLQKSAYIPFGQVTEIYGTTPPQFNRRLSNGGSQTSCKRGIRRNERRPRPVCEPIFRNGWSGSSAYVCRTRPRRKKSSVQIGRHISPSRRNRTQECFGHSSCPARSTNHGSAGCRAKIRREKVTWLTAPFRLGVLRPRSLLRNQPPLRQQQPLPRQPHRHLSRLLVRLYNQRREEARSMAAKYYRGAAR